MKNFWYCSLFGSSWHAFLKEFMASWGLPDRYSHLPFKK